MIPTVLLPSNRSPWKSWLLFLALVAASVRPAWSAPRPTSHLVHEAVRGLVSAPVLEGVSSCCLEPEPASCCAEDGDEDRGPTIVPLCCGVDELPARSREPASVPRWNTGDPSESWLRTVLVARLERPADFASVCAEPGFRPRPNAPPDPLRGGSFHWLTDREPRAALAWLSVARL